MTTQSPGMTAERLDWGTLWRYPFKTLSVDGIAINDPRIAIYPDDGPDCQPDLHYVGGTPQRCFGSADLHLHAQTLKALHLYFDFKKKALHVTAADAHP